MTVTHRRAKGTGRKDRRRGFRNVPMDRLNEQRVAPRREGGVHDPTVLTEREGIRAAIAAQMCPFCERGPFKMLPVHTNKIHGIDKWELRDLAGYTTTDPLCSEEARAAMAVKAHPEQLVKARQAMEVKGRRKPRRTTAGLEKNTKNLLTWAEANPELAREQAAIAGRSATPESKAKRLETLRRKWEADPAAKERTYAHLNRPDVRAKAIAAAIAVNRRPIPEHGNINRYKHHGCRCDPCREAKAIDRRKVRCEQ